MIVVSLYTSKIEKNVGTLLSVEHVRGSGVHTLNSKHFKTKLLTQRDPISVKADIWSGTTAVEEKN